MATDDIASLLVRQPAATMRYGQGKIIEFDTDTFENVIEWNGVRLSNLPVVGTTDALSYAPGQLVALHGADPSGQKATTQWWIAGRMLVPGSDNAEAIVAFLRGALAREISAEIFADRVFSASSNVTAVQNSTSFGDPDTGGDPGPTASDVPIVSGKAIVVISADVKFSSDDTATSDFGAGGFMSYRISGATSRAPDAAAKSLGAFIQKYNNSGAVDVVAGDNGNITVSKVVIEEGLNEGDHDFKCEYQRFSGATEPCEFGDPTIMIIAF